MKKKKRRQSQNNLDIALCPCVGNQEPIAKKAQGLQASMTKILPEEARRRTEVPNGSASPAAAEVELADAPVEVKGAKEPTISVRSILRSRTTDTKILELG